MIIKKYVRPNIIYGKIHTSSNIIFGQRHASSNIYGETKPQELKQPKKILESKKTPKNKKQYIPKALKRAVWHEWIGEEKGKHKCLCCNISDITQLSFHCGHIIAESKGGELNIKNLKPICELCNKSMGSKNMNEFVKLFKTK